MRIRIPDPDQVEWLERLTANAEVSAVLGSIPASSDTVESERRQMKQCWMKYIFKNQCGSGSATLGLTPFYCLFDLNLHWNAGHVPPVHLHEPHLARGERSHPPAEQPDRPLSRRLHLRCRAQRLSLPPRQGRYSSLIVMIPRTFLPDYSMQFLVIL